MIRKAPSLSSGGDRRGQALVEFALVIPVFLLLIMGIVDLGRAVYANNTVNNAAREAGRRAIVDQTILQVRTEALQAASNLAVVASDVSIDFRSSSTPNVANSCGTLVIGCLAHVTVDYQFTAATPVIGQIIGTVSMRGESFFPIESVCVEPTPAVCPRGS